MEYKVKRISLWQHLGILLFIAVAVVAALKDFHISSEKSGSAATETAEPSIGGEEPIPPIPLSLVLDERKVALGERLYHDRRLSHDNTISCASCHDLQKGGTDQVKYSTGIDSSLGGINSPTTFNSGFNFVQFWDGRAIDLQEQASGPVHNPIEMGSDWDEVIPKLIQDDYYQKAFQDIYFTDIEPQHITDAIAVYERSLITPGSRFDLFLQGDQTILTAEEKDGYRLFKEYGCISCHQGVNMGGNMYQTMGVMDDYFKHRPTTEADLGRFNVTKQEWNRFQFKVPTLRNIAITYPYLHDGSAATLEEVLKVMWNSQLGRNLQEQEVQSIVQFLKTLTGTYQGKPL